MQETEEKKKPTSKKWGIIAVIAAVIVAIIVGISIYNTPENRLQRQIDLGNRYLQEQNYAEAALAFEKAIAIDERCMAAYAGGLEAYLGAGDAENAKTFYDKTLTMLLGLDADYVTANRDSIVELYLSAEKVYADNPEKVAEILEDAYQRAGENQRLKVKLIETYLGIAKEKTESGAYEEALVIYDRLIELDREDADMIADLSDCLNRYIELLMQEERYDEIRALAEKYGDIATGVDFAAVLEQIEKRKTWVDVSPELFTFQIAGYDLWEDHTEEVMDALRPLAVSEEIESSNGWTHDSFYTEDGVKIEHTYSNNPPVNGISSPNDIFIRQPVDWYSEGKDGYIIYQGEWRSNERVCRELIIGLWSAGAKWAGGEREETIDFDQYIHCPVGKTTEEWYSLIGREQIMSRGQESDPIFADSHAWRFQTEWGEGYYEEATRGVQNASLLAIDCSAEKGEKQIFSLCVEMDENGNVDAIYVYTGNCYAWDECGFTANKAYETGDIVMQGRVAGSDVFDIYENGR